MADPKIIEYVQTSMAQGVAPEDIRRALIDQGWSQYDIDEAMSLAGQGGGAYGAQQPMPPSGGGKAGGSFDLKAILSASEREYTPEYLYKVILEVAVFSIASLILIPVGLPWFIPIGAIGVMAVVAFLQITRVKSRTAAAEQVS